MTPGMGVRRSAWVVGVGMIAGVQPLGQRTARPGSGLLRPTGRDRVILMVGPESRSPLG